MSSIEDHKEKLQTKRWTFTLNNPTPDEEKAFLDLAVGLGQPVVYLIVGREVGERGTPHFQGYLESGLKLRMGGARRLCLGLSRAAMFASKGTGEENKEYCSKQGRLLREAGELTRKGQRSDLLAVKRSIDDGLSPLEIADLHFASFCRYRKSFAEYRQLKAPKTRRLDLRVSLYFGKSGTGKTRAVCDAHESDLYWWTGEGNWYDGYDGQRVVLFDDYDGECIKYETLLRITDVYPVQLPVKGGFVWFRPELIFFTSNKPFEDWYHFREEKDALRRRFHEFREFV